MSPKESEDKGLAKRDGMKIPSADRVKNPGRPEKV